jgi:hypothetical protein
MAEHYWGGRRIQPLLEMHIAVTDAGSDGAHADFVGAGCTDIDIFNGQGLKDFAEYCSFHRSSPVRRRKKSGRCSATLPNAARTDRTLIDALVKMVYNGRKLDENQPLFDSAAGLRE